MLADVEGVLGGGEAGFGLPGFAASGHGEGDSGGPVAVCAEAGAGFVEESFDDVEGGGVVSEVGGEDVGVSE